MILLVTTRAESNFTTSIIPVRKGIPLGGSLTVTQLCYVVLSHSVVSDSLRPHGLYSPWNSPGQNTGIGSLSLLQGNLPNPGMEPRSPALQADSLPAEPPGKPKAVNLQLKK